MNPRTKRTKSQAAILGLNYSLLVAIYSTPTGNSGYKSTVESRSLTINHKPLTITHHSRVATRHPPTRLQIEYYMSIISFCGTVATPVTPRPTGDFTAGARRGRDSYVGGGGGGGGGGRWRWWWWWSVAVVVVVVGGGRIGNGNG
ncbi:hypothetical protein BZA05DRAFT_434491 [Tricharina praecox]|uniref:uncharacterized protein n=1 Tax=Tricharina praecox TaxID=43433 RepID=UPI00221F8415|nr:uncharacterized protein BZA05DRAFT_434491 [Tricharina praecox]KAI5856072.1 hypothetical protein BZA05DRAFT_434491 [Tricharina praecox]